MTIFRRRSSRPGLNGPARSPARSCNDGHRSPCCHARVPRPSRVSIPRVGVGMRHCSRSSSLPSPRVSRSWTRISRNALPPMPTRTASAPCPVPVRRAPRDCSPPSAPTVVGSPPPPPPPCSRAPGSPRSPSAVGRRNRSDGVGAPTRSAAKHSMSSRAIRFGIVCGRNASTTSSEPAARRTMRRCAPSHSSGFAFCGDAGTTTPCTTTRATQARSPCVALH